MAMKVAPDPIVSDIGVRRTPVGILVVKDEQELNQLSKAVSDVIYHGPPHRSKYVPRINAPKAKAVKAEVTKPKAEPLEPTIPVLEQEAISQDDERYALWWDFHINRTEGEYPKYKGIKVYSYPVDPKEREAAIKSSRRSRDSRAHINVIKALGCTPNGRKSSDLVGVAPHHGDPELFPPLLERNKQYVQELVSRYCSRVEINRALDTVCESDTPYWGSTFVDPIEITRSVAKPSGTQEVDISGMISKLEQHIADTPVQTAKVSAVTADQMRYDDKLARAEAKVFDLDMDDVLAGSYYSVPAQVNAAAANDEVFVSPVVDDTSTDVGQLLTPQQYLHAHKHEPLAGDEYAQYCIALHRMEEYSGKETRLWYGEYEYQMSDEDLYIESRKEAARYLGWLHKHDVNNAVRTSVEYARHVAVPMYEMDLGIDVPAVYHLGEDAYNQTVEHNMKLRIRLYDDGLLNNDSFKAVMTRNTYGLLADLTPIEKPIVDVSVLDQEELIDKIVDNAIERHSRKTTFKEWNQNVANFIEYCKSEPATGSKDSPTPNTGAEIVDLTMVRNARAEGMSNLLEAVKPKLAGLTPEQAEGARVVLKEMLELLG